MIPVKWEVIPPPLLTEQSIWKSDKTQTHQGKQVEGQRAWDLGREKHKLSLFGEWQRGEAR